ncbi:phosphoenolpyruvate carboxylase 3-like [Populus nigra]|uniref:phosphoenolpyruvate carboxylase 3-like n=1 Tax=Populus nigra TaxID=3691 RepID=UPI002B27AFDA|nr:phosphoenolpyruvate carboxylase 3-like [Populus nigra]
MRATPEMEYGWMKIGSRPSTRKPSGGIETLRAEQSGQKRANSRQSNEKDRLARLFLIDNLLVEMAFAMGDPGFAALYDKTLIAEHEDLLEGDPYSKQRLRLREVSQPLMFAKPPL